jgi:hypothetical protein
MGLLPDALRLARYDPALYASRVYAVATASDSEYSGACTRLK